LTLANLAAIRALGASRKDETSTARLSDPDNHATIDTA
jgi:hypothetical protein